MVAGQPVTTLTGADIQQLAAYISNLLAQTRQSGLNAAGYSDYGALGIGQGYGPNLAMLSLQAARDDANRNYGLNLQRYGLDYANTAFNQQMSAASHQLATLDLQTRRSGPEDWLRYNYVVNNAPGAPAPTVGAQAPQAPTPTVGAGAGGPGQLQLMPPQQGSSYYIDGEKQASNPFGQSPTGSWHSASQGEYDRMAGAAQQSSAQAQGPDTTAGFDTVAKADGSQGVQLDAGEIAAGAQWQPSPTDANGHFLLAFGGQAPHVGGGMHAAVVGDPQRGNRANPEMVMSSAPIFVKPLQGENAAGPEARKAAQQLPHYATGGVTGGYADAPFVSKLTQGGGAAFGGRGEELGPYGSAPIDYGRFLQLLPSEQAMTKGYIETPKDQGGLGGWFPDEMERARRASFQGLSLGQSGYAA